LRKLSLKSWIYGVSSVLMRIAIRKTLKDPILDVRRGWQE
jgi:hypothetical protein